MALSDVLQRFRRIWAPPGGPAGTTGIPADQRLELTTELTAVLAALDEIDAECGQIIAAARREADAIGAQARQQADHIAAAGRSRAERERARAAQERRAAAREVAAARLEEARCEADRIRGAAARRQPALLEEIVTTVRSAAPVAERGDRVVAGMGRR